MGVFALLSRTGSVRCCFMSPVSPMWRNRIRADSLFTSGRNIMTSWLIMMVRMLLLCNIAVCSCGFLLFHRGRHLSRPLMWPMTHLCLHCKNNVVIHSPDHLQMWPKWSQICPQWIYGAFTPLLKAVHLGSERAACKREIICRFQKTTESKLSFQYMIILNHVFFISQRFTKVGSRLCWRLEGSQVPPPQKSMDKSPSRTRGAVSMLLSGVMTSGFIPTRRASSWVSPPSLSPWMLPRSNLQENTRFLSSLHTRPSSTHLSVCLSIWIPATCYCPY